MEVEHGWLRRYQMNVTDAVRAESQYVRATAGEK